MDGMGGLSIIIGHRSSLVQITKIASQRLPLTTQIIQRFASELMWLLALLLRATLAQFPTTLRLEKVKSISISQISLLWIKNVVLILFLIRRWQRQATQRFAKSSLWMQQRGSQRQGKPSKKKEVPYYFWTLIDYFAIGVRSYWFCKKAFQ